MMQQSFPFSEVPYKESHDKSESYGDGMVSLDPENVKIYGSVEGGKKVNMISLLSNPKSGRDFLVNSSGEQVKVTSIIGKYILIHSFKLPVDSYSKQGLICWALKRAIPHWPNFQLVVVTKMDNKKVKTEREAVETFNTFVATFPDCLAIPVSDSHSYDRVYGFYQPEDYLLSDPNGIAISSSMCIMHHGAAAFPFTIDHYDTLNKTVWNWLEQRPVPLENLLGLGLSDILYNSAANTISVSHLKHKLVGLYLYKSGDYMDPIHKAYQYCQANNLDLDIVLVYLPLSDDPSHFITCTHAALRDKGISSWWLLPFNDSTTRRLWLLCQCSKKDELIIVGPQGQFLDSFAANIVTDTKYRPGVLKDMYPYAAEAVARQETDRLNELTLASFFSSPERKFLLTRKGNRRGLQKLQGKIVCLFIANFRHFYDALEAIKDWCLENKGCKDTNNIALVFVPIHSSKRKLNYFTTRNSSRKSSWLWDSTMPWLICPPHPVVEASIIKHTTFQGLGCCCYELSYFTFGEDGKLLPMTCPDLSEIQANSFPPEGRQLYEDVLEVYTDGFEYVRDDYDCY